jgi:hypothetical protein
MPLTGIETQSTSQKPVTLLPEFYRLIKMNEQVNKKGKVIPVLIFN